MSAGKALWIRVEAHELDSLRVARLAAALRIKPVQALGHLVALAGNVAEHTPGGHIADVPEAALEQWSGWSGKVGVFAAAARKHLEDPATGQLGNWEDTMGNLVERRERDAERMRLKRATRPGTGAIADGNGHYVREQSPDGSFTNVEQSATTERHTTERHVVPSTLSSDSDTSAREMPEAVEIFVRKFYSTAGEKRQADVRAQLKATLCADGARIKGGECAKAVNIAHLARCLATVMRDKRPKDPNVAIQWALLEIRNSYLEALSEQSRAADRKRDSETGPTMIAATLCALSAPAGSLGVSRERPNAARL